MIKYIVNKEKRTVVAMIKFVDEDGDSIPTFKNSEFIFDDLWSVLKRIKHDGNTFCNREYRKKVNKMFFPNHIVAKAKCSPDDEWNEEFGKELARKRLVEKIHNYRSNSYKIIADMVKEIGDNFID